MLTSTRYGPPFWGPHSGQWSLSMRIAERSEDNFITNIQTKAIVGARTGFKYTNLIVGGLQEYSSFEEIDKEQ